MTPLKRWTALTKDDILIGCLHIFAARGRRIRETDDELYQRLLKEARETAIDFLTIDELMEDYEENNLAECNEGGTP